MSVLDGFLNKEKASPLSSFKYALSQLSNVASSNLDEFSSFKITLWVIPRGSCFAKCAQPYKNKTPKITDTTFFIIL